MAYFGAAALTWTDAAGDHVMLLQAPLRAQRNAIGQRRWVRESLDLLNRNIVTVGSGVYELVGTVRYVDAGQSLADMLLAGVRGETINYVPDADDPDRSWACWLVAPGEGAVAQLDADRGFPGFEDQQIEIRLRRTDGLPFT